MTTDRTREHIEEFKPYRHTQRVEEIKLCQSRTKRKGKQIKQEYTLRQNIISDRTGEHREQETYAEH